jgi:hypothetical protein
MSSALAPVRLALAAMLILVAAAGSAAQPLVIGLDGAPVAPLGADARATVLLFTAVDCPISNRYAPEVRRLAARYAASGVRIWLVYANRDESPAAARTHATAFDYGLPVALDPGGVLADRAGATVTPQVAVFDRAGGLAYLGRIDDRYLDFGVDRPVPTTHDLADALAAVTAGRPVPVARTRAVGCAIVRHAP